MQRPTIRCYHCHYQLSSFWSICCFKTQSPLTRHPVCCATPQCATLRYHPLRVTLSAFSGRKDMCFMSPRLHSCHHWRPWHNTTRNMSHNRPRKSELRPGELAPWPSPEITRLGEPWRNEALKVCKARNDSSGFSSKTVMPRCPDSGTFLLADLETTTGVDVLQLVREC